MCPLDFLYVNYLKTRTFKYMKLYDILNYETDYTVVDNLYIRISYICIVRLNNKLLHEMILVLVDKVKRTLVDLAIKLNYIAHKNIEQCN